MKQKYILIMAGSILLVLVAFFMASQSPSTQAAYGREVTFADSVVYPDFTLTRAGSFQDPVFVPITHYQFILKSAGGEQTIAWPPEGDYEPVTVDINGKKFSISFKESHHKNTQATGDLSAYYDIVTVNVEK
jgi:hypothetical protein